MIRATRFFHSGLFLLAAGLLGTAVIVSAAGEDNPKPLAPLPRTAPDPKDNLTTHEKVALGKQLFFDPRLSGDNRMSCAPAICPIRHSATVWQEPRGMVRRH